MIKVRPRNFTTPGCEFADKSGVDVPPGYVSYNATGIGFAETDTSLEPFAVYDLKARQPVPMVITSRFGGSEKGNAAVVCVAPRNAAKGSREPQGEFENSGGDVVRVNGMVLLGVLTSLGVYLMNI